MLTHKQLWRRQKAVTRFSSNISNAELDFYEAYIQSKPPSPSGSKLFASEDEYDDHSLSPTADKPKKVRFNNFASTQLIPTRMEYYEQGLEDQLWWKKNDYNDFKDSAIIDLRNIMRLHCNIDCKIAKALLFQPHSQHSDKIKEILYQIAKSLQEKLHFNSISQDYSRSSDDNSNAINNILQFMQNISTSEKSKPIEAHPTTLIF